MNCPYCQSDIHEKCIKCPFCHSYIIEKKKEKTFFRIFTAVFSGVFLAGTGIIFILILTLFNFYDVFQVRFDYKSAKECSVNREYLSEAVSVYNEVNTDSILSLEEKYIIKLEKFLGESDFIRPECPLGGKYYMDENGIICCTKHKTEKKTNISE